MIGRRRWPRSSSVENVVMPLRGSWFPQTRSGLSEDGHVVHDGRSRLGWPASTMLHGKRSVWVLRRTGFVDCRSGNEFCKGYGVGRSRLMVGSWCPQRDSADLAFLKQLHGVSRSKGMFWPHNPKILPRRSDTNARRSKS